jgi:hypothetical protein
MARDIDLSKPLSADELAYVNDRPWLKQEAQLQGLTITAADDDFTVDADDDNTTASASAATQLPVPGTEDAGDGGSEDGDEEDESYESWSVDALKEELGNRGLTKSGSKEQLIARLEEDDETAE